MSFREKLFASTVLFLLLCSMIACGDKYVYASEKAIPEASWSFADTLDFTIPVADTSKLFNLYIEFTSLDSFANQNIYLKIHTRFPNGKRVQRVRSFDLYDVSGKPLGKCSGNTCTTKILLQNNLYFNQLGDHLITLEQFTRANPLGGISQVGLMMEETKAKK